MASAAEGPDGAPFATGGTGLAPQQTYVQCRLRIFGSVTVECSVFGQPDAMRTLW